MENKNSNSTEIIQLVKCIIEYYGTTTINDSNNIPNELKNIDFENSDILKEALNEISDFNFDELTIKIPSEIDEEIKKTFISELGFLRKNH